MESWHVTEHGKHSTALAVILTQTHGAQQIIIDESNSLTGILMGKNKATYHKILILSILL